MHLQAQRSSKSSSSHRRSFHSEYVQMSPHNTCLSNLFFFLLTLGLRLRSRPQNLRCQRDLLFELGALSRPFPLQKPYACPPERTALARCLLLLPPGLRCAPRLPLQQRLPHSLRRQPRERQADNSPPGPREATEERGRRHRRHTGEKREASRRTFPTQPREGRPCLH